MKNNFITNCTLTQTICNENDRKTISALFNSQTVPKLSQQNKDSCECNITMEEVGKALKELKNGKSPGTDGFTPDFYNKFWLQIKELVFQSIKYAEENNILSIEQRQGVINLIPQKEKYVWYLKNWRPISLLNTDYKIITKLIATRI